MHQAKLQSFKVIGLDTMGTLLDERAGITAAYRPSAEHLKDPVQSDKLHDAINEILHQRMVACTQEKQTPPYRDLLAAAHKEATKRLSNDQYIPSSEESLAFADGLARWPAFSDTVAAMQELAKGSKLVLLSNMDTVTLQRIADDGALKGVPIAKAVGCDISGGFKPNHVVNNALLQYAKTEFGVDKSEVLLVAQGLASDHVPAAELGIASAWIDRYGAGESAMVEAGAKPTWAFSNLASLVEAMKAEP